MGQFLNKPLYADETKYDIPALDRTGKIVLPAPSKMTARAAWINSYIHAKLGDVVFTWGGNEYLVERISKLNSDFYLVEFTDYCGKKRAEPWYRFHEISLPMGEE